MGSGGLGAARLLMLCSALAGPDLACRSQARSEATPRIEFGVLFGGDIQDRPVIPLELDRSRQELALRVTFEEPVQRERRIQFELERPPAAGKASGIAEIGEIRAYPGELRAETKLGFRRGDPTGAWQLKVRIDDREPWVRRFEVIAPPR